MSGRNQLIIFGGTKFWGRAIAQLPTPGC